MAVFDCCMFFNENDIFEIRLHTHWNLVDKFVVVEAGETHTGLKKPFNFDIDRFSPYMSKIHYVTFESFQEEMARYPELDCAMGHKYHNNQFHFLDDWKRDHFQGNYLYKILKDLGADDTDIVYISPVDELVREAAFVEGLERFSTKESFQVHGSSNLLRPIFGFKNYYYIWKFNLLRDPNTVGGLMTEIGNFKTHLPSTIRSAEMRTHPHLDKGGWHFSYPDPTDGERVLTKYKSWAHSRDPYGVGKQGELRFNVESKEQALGMLFRECKVTIVPITSGTHPPYIIDNIEKFKPYIYDGDGQVLKGH